MVVRAFPKVVVRPVVVRPSERRIWAWKHGRGELKHLIKERILHEIVFSDGELIRSDIVYTVCGRTFDLHPEQGDDVLPWCNNCARTAKKWGMAL